MHQILQYMDINTTMLLLVHWRSGFVPVAACRAPKDHTAQIRDLYGIRCSKSGRSLVYGEWWHTAAKGGLDLCNEEFSKLPQVERESCVLLQNLAHARAVMDAETFERYATLHGWVASEVPTQIHVPDESITERFHVAHIGNLLWPLPPPGPSVPVANVSCDGNYFACISRASRTLYTFGMCTGEALEDEWGLGHGPFAAHGRTGGGAALYRPQIVAALRNTRIQGVDCGLCHTVCVAESGELYTWGRGMHGRLGHGDDRDRWIPTRVRGFSAVAEACCGDHFTLVRSSQQLDTRDRVYDKLASKFFDHHGNRTSRTNRTNLDRMTQKAFAEYDAMNPAEISAMYGHNVPQGEGGSGVFVFGKGEEGQLGLGFMNDAVLVPTELCCRLVADEQMSASSSLANQVTDEITFEPGSEEEGFGPND